MDVPKLAVYQRFEKAYEVGGYYMSPEQELYDAVFAEAQSMSYSVYDHLPLKTENAPYPFVLVGDIETAPDMTKTSLGGRISLTIDVWGSGEDRSKVSSMLEALSQIGRGFLYTTDFRFVGRPPFTSKQILTDTSVPDTVLLHGVLTLVFDLC